jgi:hypothetical protein
MLGVFLLLIYNIGKSICIFDIALIRRFQYFGTAYLGNLTSLLVDVVGLEICT